MHFKHSLQGLFLLSLSWIKVKDTNLQKANYSLIRNLVFRILALKSGNIKEVLWKIEGILWKSSSRQTDLGKGDCYPPFTHHSGFIGAASFICCAKKHQKRLKEKPICRMIVLFFFFISSIFSEAYRPSTNSLQVRGLPLFPFLSRTGRQLLICYHVQPPKGNITSYLQNRPPQVLVNKLESITCL